MDIGQPVTPDSQFLYTGTTVKQKELDAWIFKICFYKGYLTPKY